jgi:hypothetical protein
MANLEQPKGSWVDSTGSEKLEGKKITTSISLTSVVIQGFIKKNGCRQKSNVWPQDAKYVFFLT